MMTESEMRVAIAEKCGYTTKRLGDGVDYPVDPEGGFPCIVPNYTQSLDAIHEAEKVLTPAQANEYNLKLDLAWTELNPRPSALSVEAYSWHTTALQRAEALCRVMFPERWKD